jgi:hypothetical protein
MEELTPKAVDSIVSRSFPNLSRYAACVADSGTRLFRAVISCSLGLIFFSRRRPLQFLRHKGTVRIFFVISKRMALFESEGRI